MYPLTARYSSSAVPMTCCNHTNAKSIVHVACTAQPGCEGYRSTMTLMRPVDRSPVVAARVARALRRHVRVRGRIV